MKRKILESLEILFVSRPPAIEVKLLCTGKVKIKNEKPSGDFAFSVYHRCQPTSR